MVLNFLHIFSQFCSFFAQKLENIIYLLGKLSKLLFRVTYNAPNFKLNLFICCIGSEDTIPKCSVWIPVPGVVLILFITQTAQKLWKVLAHHFVFSLVPLSLSWKRFWKWSGEGWVFSILSQSPHFESTGRISFR